MSLKTRFHYIRVLLFSYVIGAPSILLGLTFKSIWPCSYIDGIALIDSNANTRSMYVSTLTNAIQLIFETDKVWSNRIKREIRIIFNVPIFRASYSRPLRICDINFQFFKETFDEKTVVPLIACFLVHEAAHGFLFTKGIPQTKRNLERIEDFCCRAMFRFGKRIGIHEQEWDMERNQGSSLAEIFQEIRNVIGSFKGKQSNDKQE